MSFPIHAKKCLLGMIAAPLLMPTNSEAVLVIAGVTDGTLSGGNPKAIIIQAGADIADMSLWGVGSANNGGGTDGQEYTFPAGSATAGDVWVLPGNADSYDFFANNFVQNFNLVDLTGNFVASVNGDDAIELFFNGAVVDTYGDPDVNGDNEVWDYTDGYATRKPSAPGAFDINNYDVVKGGFLGVASDEAGHVAIFEAAGFDVIPEPGAATLLLLGAGLLFRRRR